MVEYPLCEEVTCKLRWEPADTMSLEEEVGWMAGVRQVGDAEGSGLCSLAVGSHDRAVTWFDLSYLN